MVKLRSKHIFVLDGSPAIRWLINILGGIHVKTLDMHNGKSPINHLEKSNTAAMTTTTFYECAELEKMSKNAAESDELQRRFDTVSVKNISKTHKEPLMHVLERELVRDSIVDELTPSRNSHETTLKIEPTSNVSTVEESHHRPHRENSKTLTNSKNSTLPPLGNGDSLESYRTDSHLPVIEDTPEWTYGYDPQYKRRVLAVTSKFIQKMDNQDAADFVNTLDPLLIEELLKENSLPPVVKGIIIGKKVGNSEVSLANFLSTQKALKNNTHFEKSSVHTHNLTGVKDGN